MRIFTEGFEGGHITNSLFPITSGCSVVSNTVRKDVNGNGGNYSMFSSLGGLGRPETSTRYPFQICYNKNIYPREFWFRCGVYAGGIDKEGFFTFRNTAKEPLLTILINNSSSQIEIRNGSRTDPVLTTGSISFPKGQWVLLECHAYLHPTSGFMKVYINGEDTTFVESINPVLSASAYEFGHLTIGLHGGWIDDIGANAVTMSYDSGTGIAPVAGNTITGGTSGASAIITAVEGDEVSGRLWLENVDIDTNPFVNDEDLTDGAGFIAKVYAPTSSYEYGLEPQSWRLNDGYIVGMRPNGDDAIQLQGSDGDQINNYQLVDDAPGAVNTTDYVFGTTDGESDLYDIESFTDIGFSVGQVDKINAVNLRAYLKRSGINVKHIKFKIKPNINIYESEEVSLPIDWDIKTWDWGYNPDTEEAWDESEINSLITGIEFKS